MTHRWQLPWAPPRVSIRPGVVASCLEPLKAAFGPPYHATPIGATTVLGYQNVAPIDGVGDF